MELIIITGMSGAGKSIALNTLEDNGFEAIDNLPLPFLKAVLASGEKMRRIAVGIDIRSHSFSPEQFSAEMKALRAQAEITLKIIYLDCEDDALRRRFTETRRRHPLASDRPLLDGISHERSLLEPSREIADVVIDTTEMQTTELRRLIFTHVKQEKAKLALFITSFSFRKGLPREADLVVDVRFLRNPHYDERLRPLTGKDALIAAYIEEDADFGRFFENLKTWLIPLLPRYMEEGKSYLTIAIGCTGGRHRSVFTSEKLADALKAEGYAVSVRHREL